MSLCQSTTSKGVPCRKRSSPGGVYCHIHLKDMERLTPLDRIITKKELPVTKSSLTVQCHLELPPIGSDVIFQDQSTKISDYVYEKEKIVGLETELGKFYASPIGWINENSKLFIPR